MAGNHGAKPRGGTVLARLARRRIFEFRRVRPFQIAAAAADAHDDRPPETASAGASRQRIRRIDARP